MPYVDSDARKRIELGLNGVQTVGDLNYLLTTLILQMWNTRQSYQTIHDLRKELVTDPKNSKYISVLRRELADRFTVADMYTAAALAFEEFYQRVGRLYEAMKCRENGDVPGYTEAIAPLLLQIGSEIKKESVSGLILPGQGVNK